VRSGPTLSLEKKSERVYITASTNCSNWSCLIIYFLTEFGQKWLSEMIKPNALL
jgi:hypothetical protein